MLGWNGYVCRSCLEFIIHLHSTCHQLVSSSSRSDACGTLLRNSQETPRNQPKPFSTMTEASLLFSSSTLAGFSRPLLETLLAHPHSTNESFRCSPSRRFFFLVNAPLAGAVKMRQSPWHEPTSIHQCIYSIPHGVWN
ncbi:Uncharacterized protein HZ326_27885 [Fusarium oxysporum f. sp. albedinis]|nr:Uncharacterized protein HZ326_27885 [Fusarium oxysporum f. sp. albedinis]